MLKVCAPDAVPLDEEFKLKQETEYIKHGIIKPNEIRIQKGYDDAEEVDQFFVSNLAPLQQPEVGEQVEPARMFRGYEDLGKYWRQVDEKKQKLEDEQLGVVRRLYDKFKVASINNLNKARQEKNDEFVVMTDEVITVAEMIEIISAFLAPEVVELVREGFENMKGEIKGSDTLYSQSNPKVRQAVDQVLNNHFKIADTNHERLSKVITELVGQKASFSDIVKAVSEFYPQEFQARGKTTAQTLVTTSFESGQQILMEEEGVARERWLSQRDGRVRDTHINADGQEIKVNDSFSVGGSMLRYPGDPMGASDEVIGCRCTVIPIFDL
jgi:predicted P-loop ATPase/GTPase